jgi:uncharacterized membrane protein
MGTVATVAPVHEPGEDLRFDAVLYPSRSLPPAGFALLMTAVVLASTAIGAGFFLIGAWPVTGFFGLDVVLVYFAFRWNYRQARRAEFIRLDADVLLVRRVEPSGRSREWRFDPYWVQVRIDAATDRLILRSHGQQIAIGDFLVAAEREEVATALRHALGEHRAPALT